MASAVTVNVEQLLGELAQQRRDRAGVSTTSINLIAFVENDPRLLERMAERIDTLAQRNVSRTLLLSAEQREHATRSHCIEIENTLVTHSEQIELSVENVDAPELRSIVHDLLVPNVRSVLLWGGAHLDDPRFTVLADLADIVVLFSSARGGGVEPLREIVKLVGTAVGSKLRDLSYLRLLTWQDTIAQFFDEADLAAELPHICKVQVESGSSAEAYYLVAWLASRLAWDPCGRAEFCNADGKSIKVEMRRQGEPRHIYGITLQSQHSTFGVSVDPQAEDLLCLTVEGQKQRPKRCAPLHDVDMITLIERAIFEQASAQVYADTLQMLGRLLEHA
jgi:glucose-6-phosphate dehydrogenase assembly protein OpcA